MPTTYKVLGQSAPSTTANTDIYTVPAARSAIISSLVITNTTGTAATARVFVRVAGAAAAISQAVVYDVPVTANSTIALTLGITMAATDVLTVQTNTANTLAFQAFGSELS